MSKTDYLARVEGLVCGMKHLARIFNFYVLFEVANLGWLTVLLPIAGFNANAVLGVRFRTYA